MSIVESAMHIAGKKINSSKKGTFDLKSLLCQQVAVAQSV
jgi:hypothetical protein